MYCSAHVVHVVIQSTPKGARADEGVMVLGFQNRNSEGKTVVDVAK